MVSPRRARGQNCSSCKYATGGVGWQDALNAARVIPFSVRRQNYSVSLLSYLSKGIVLWAYHMDEVFRALRAQCLCASWRFGRLSLLSSSVRRPCRQRLKPGPGRDRGGRIKQLTENRMPLHPRCCRFKESRKNKTADRPSKADPLLMTVLRPLPWPPRTPDGAGVRSGGNGK